MRIYTNETTSKHYISYAAAVLSMLELGFDLVSNVGENEKAVFTRKTMGMFGSDPIEYGYIAYMDTEDEIATPAAIDALA